MYFTHNSQYKGITFGFNNNMLMSINKRDKLPPNWPKKIRGHKYVYAEKIQALRILEQNDFNYYKTGKLLDVIPNTLRVWVDKFGSDVFKPREKIIEKTLCDIEKRNQSFLDLAFDTKEDIIKKIKELVPITTNILTLATTLEAIHKCTSSEVGVKSSEEDLKPTNLYFQLNQQLIEMSENHGKKNQNANNRD